MTLGLDGRNVVITGGAGGLGGAVVEAFVAAGAVCHLPQRGSEGGTGASHSSLRVVSGVDLTSEAGVATFYAALPPLWASVHLAGGFAAATLLETSLDDVRRQLDLNLTTAFLCCREAVRSMQRSAGGGRIVNVGSRAALLPAGGMLAYSLSKAAVGMLTQALAEELKPRGILVNAVVPSIIDTPANRAASPKADHDRWPKPAEIARSIVWLASPENRLTSGALVPVYGEA